MSLLPEQCLEVNSSEEEEMHSSSGYEDMMEGESSGCEVHRMQPALFQVSLYLLQ